tara:strand:- start:57 stop:335 length:279 start_codon:yes stop_codon:yes gene_type:complete
VKGPSFDCRKARTWDEKVICASPELALLQIKLHEAYRDKLFKTRNEGGKRALATSQLKWMEITNKCKEETDPTACLQSQMSARLDWVNRFGT